MPARRPTSCHSLHRRAARKAGSPRLFQLAQQVVAAAKRHCGSNSENLSSAHVRGLPLRAAGGAQVVDMRTFPSADKESGCGIRLKDSASFGAALQEDGSDRAADRLGVELGLRADGLGAGPRGARQPAGRAAQAAVPSGTAANRSHDAAAAPLQPGRRRTNNAVDVLLVSCTRSTRRNPRPTSCTRSRSWLTWPASGPSRSAAARPSSCTALAVVNAYNYLFDDRFGRYRNPYDPEFRGACDLYNGALESMLRIIKKQGGLTPGSDAHDSKRPTRQSKPRSCSPATTGGPRTSQEFRFVSDYEITRAAKPVSQLRLGRAADRGPQAPRQRQPRREVLSARA